MRLRDTVLLAYGGRCAWCGSTPHLEIDHVYGDGNAHRASIHVKLETWLWRQYQETGFYPSGFQVLCTDCHDRKSKRTRKMPPAKGKAAITIAFPDDLHGVLASMAGDAKYSGSKSAVLETAFRHFVEGSVEITALDAVHQHLSTLKADMQGQVQEIQSATQALLQNLARVLQCLQQNHSKLEERIAALERQHTHHYNDLVRAYDTLAKERKNTASGGLRALFRPT